MERTLRTLKSKNDVNPGELMSLYNQVLAKLNTAEHALKLHAQRINELTLFNEQQIVPGLGRAEMHLFALIKQAIKGGMHFADLQQDIQELVQANNLEEYWGIAVQDTTNSATETSVATTGASVAEEVGHNYELPESTGHYNEAPAEPLEKTVGSVNEPNTDRAQLARWPKIKKEVICES